MVSSCFFPSQVSSGYNSVINHPPVITSSIVGINLSFPVMGGVWHCYTHIKWWFSIANFKSPEGRTTMASPRSLSPKSSAILSMQRRRSCRWKKHRQENRWIESMGFIYIKLRIYNHESYIYIYILSLCIYIYIYTRNAKVKHGYIRNISHVSYIIYCVHQICIYIYKII